MRRHHFSFALRPASLLLALAASIAAFPARSEAQVSTPTGAAGYPYALYIAEAATRFGLSEVLIRAVMRAESGGNPRAISSAGAMGLMQIMPATWASLTAQYQLGADPFDIRANLLAGAAYLRAMLDRYGDTGIALAAYNAGPRRIDGWRAGTQSLPAETLAYVTRIAPAIGIPSIASPARDADRARDWHNAALFAPRPDAVPGRSIASSDTQVFRSEVPRSPTSAVRGSPASNPIFISLSGQTAR